MPRPTPPTSRTAAPSRGWRWHALLSASIGLSASYAGCGRAAAWDLHNPSGREDHIYCGSEAQPAERREDGLFVCPNGAAFDGASIGWVAPSGTYRADVSTSPPTPYWVNFCDSVALAAFPGFDDSHPWLVSFSTTPGDPTSGWRAPVEVRTQRGYIDCARERFYYLAHSTCYVVERDREPREIPCVPEVFGAQDVDWAFVRWDGDVGSSEVAP